MSLNHTKMIATLGLACSAALVLSVAPLQARLTHTAGSGAASSTLSQCKIVVAGAHWSIRAAGGNLAGNKYTIAARNMSCASAQPWVTRFTHQRDTGRIKGPAGFTCRSFSTATSGDKLLYSGACMRPPRNLPFFEWGPKMPRA
ncbi:MAG: hypothetical protein QOH73_519 [Gaiellaceae bacterium]|jgi:hypothetical protein|nr:hypothetical protein [Gaiellaceae bacterium]